MTLGRPRRARALFAPTLQTPYGLAITRARMAVFLTTTFSLGLNGL